MAAFDLPQLPPGTYTIKAWHEKLGTSTQTITVGPNQTKEINFVFKDVGGSKLQRDVSVLLWRILIPLGFEHFQRLD